MIRAIIAPALLAGAAFGQCHPEFVQTLTAADGGPNDIFGLSVGIDDDVIAVGAVWDSPMGLQSGSAYVFERQGDTWIQTAKLVPDDGNPGDNFGRSIAVSGNTIVVGAQGEDAPVFDAGAAYVFERDGDTWIQTAKLSAADAGPSDRLGWNVDIDADTIVTSAHRDDDNGIDAGAAYVFVRDGDGWAQQAKLLAADGAPDDLFAHDIAIDGDRILVGAYHHDAAGSDAGAVYVFERDAGAWTETAKLTASDANAGYHFGRFVDLDGDVALIGSPLWWPSNFGASHVFRLVDGDWAEEATLFADTFVTQEWFGSAVAIEGDVAISGSFFISGNDPGQARIHQRLNELTWVPDDELLAPDGVNGDGFGRAIAISGDVGVFGTSANDDLGIDSGAAYVVDLGCACDADVNGDGALDVLDFVAFQQHFLTGAPQADCNGDDELSVLDFVCFQLLFQQGCR